MSYDSENSFGYVNGVPPELQPKPEPRLKIEFLTEIVNAQKPMWHDVNTSVSVVDTLTKKYVYSGSPADCLAYLNIANSGLLIDNRNK